MQWETSPKKQRSGAAGAAVAMVMVLVIFVTQIIVVWSKKIYLCRTKISDLARLRHPHFFGTCGSDFENRAQREGDGGGNGTQREAHLHTAPET